MRRSGLPGVLLSMVVCAAVLLGSSVQAQAGPLPLAVPGKVTIVDLSAEWCGPCKLQKPILQAIAEEMGERIAVVIVDAEKDRRAKPYNVKAFPTLVFHDVEGTVRFRSSGLMGRAAIMSRLDAMLSDGGGQTLPPIRATKQPTAPSAPPQPSKRNFMKLE